MVALQAIVQVLRPPMLDVGQDGAERWRIAFRLIRRHPFRPHARLIERAFEEGAGSRGITPCREGGIHYLAVLIDRPVDIGPLPVKASIRLINAPLYADCVAMRVGGCLEERQEALDPPIHGAALDNQTALSKPLDHIGIA